MKLKYKINLLALSILVAVALAIAGSGVVAIGRLTADLNRRLMTSEIEQVMQRVRSANDVLQQSGVGSAPAYVRKAQEDLIEELRTYRLGATGRLMILALPDKIALHPTLVTGATIDIDPAVLQSMASKGEGQEALAYAGKRRIFSYDRFEKWNWLVMLYVGADETYAVRNEFLGTVVLILFASLFLGSLVFLWFARVIVAPIMDLALAACAISRGDWSQPLPKPTSGDEVAELARAFGEMSGRLATAYRDLETKADELKRANVSLCAEVGERKHAEAELAALNRNLEHLVEERTAELACKAEELGQVNRKLLELDEIKSAFLTSVSHELRTPLTSVLGFTKLIRKDFTRNFGQIAAKDEQKRKVAERVVQNLGIIEHEGERLTRLIGDFLDLTKIEEGQLDWHDKTIDLGLVVQRSVNAVAGYFALKPELSILVDIPDQLPPVRADADRLQQAFINLLSNAAKFTEQGQITVKVSLTESGLLCIRVADSGIGISSEELKRVFDKFYQVDATDTIRALQRGTGLGLAITRQIVEHYGGSLRAESEPGMGSVFTIELPAAANKTLALQPETEMLDS